MAIGIKTCKICGKQYEACHTLRKNLNNEFRWRDVACCEEHGMEYLRQIMISRGQLQEEAQDVSENTQATVAAPKKNRRKKRSDADAQEEMA